MDNFLRPNLKWVSALDFIYKETKDNTCPKFARDVRTLCFFRCTTRAISNLGNLWIPKLLSKLASSSISISFVIVILDPNAPKNRPAKLFWLLKAWANSLEFSSKILNLKSVTNYVLLFCKFRTAIMRKCSTFGFRFCEIRTKPVPRFNLERRQHPVENLKN